MNIDCQIRGKSDIHEALSTMCEVEYMEGDNKVYCERCKKNTDTVLRTAISALPDMLILSLKRFDLDYNTFETVKLNSRCAFDPCLNMKKYTLEGVEAMEKATSMSDDETQNPYDDYIDPLSELEDEDYEYKLAGVLVHHGVAQGGHYYSFIRDRTSVDTTNTDKWYRFDDDEVTPFDPSQIELECFGGKVKKETKWPNGQINTVETEQLANALMLFYEKVKPSSNESSNEKDTEMKEADSSTDDNGNNLALATGLQVFDGDVKRSNSVHRSHAFLFDGEFQRFVRSMLNVTLSQNKVEDDSFGGASPLSEVSGADSNATLAWRFPILQLSISYFFDVLLHSVDKASLDDWTNFLKSALSFSFEGSKWFVHELAKRTQTVNNNWLRIYGSDCPEKSSRQSAMEIIATAIKKLTKQDDELSALKSWTQAWLQQLDVSGFLHISNIEEQKPIPTMLHGEKQVLEDVSKIGSSVSSSLGIIISFVCLLLELAPRTWQYNAEMCYLLTEMTYQSTTEGSDQMRDALQAAQIPARLIALLLREKSPARIQLAFPGASLSYDLSESVSKPITNPTAHIFPLGTNAVQNVVQNPGMVSNTSIGSPSPSDNVHTLEALASIIGIKGAKSKQLTVEVTEGKGRTVIQLTDEAVNALKIVFNECKSQDLYMDQRDIYFYMKQCGFDALTASQQRISNLIAKYGKDSKYLPLNGFMGYYKDTSQSNSIQVGLSLIFIFGIPCTSCSSSFFLQSDSIRFANIWVQA